MALALILPVDVPKQATLVFVSTKFKAVGCVTVIWLVVLHWLASVMVTLIAPAGILLCVGPLPVPADHW